MSLPVRAEPVEARTGSPFDPSTSSGLRVTGRFPVWLRRPLAVHGQWDRAKQLVKELELHTVCEEARCPNLGECWSHGNVSFMILGDRCTRRCGFCAV